MSMQAEVHAALDAIAARYKDPRYVEDAARSWLAGRAAFPDPAASYDVQAEAFGDSPWVSVQQGFKDAAEATAAAGRKAIATGLAHRVVRADRTELEVVAHVARA